MDNRKLKVGIFGYGYMGKIRERVALSHPQLELMGIYDPKETARQKITKCKAFSSANRLLEEAVDIIFVCTPNRFSPELVIEGLKQGKHVFCEKPPGRNVQDIKNIIRYETKKTKLMFGFNHRFHPSFNKAKVIIDSKRMGGIINLRGTYGKSGGQYFLNSWRNDKEIAGGGILLDQGVHMLDLFRYFCGDFDYIKCFLSNFFWKAAVEDNAYVILQNKIGQTATLHSSSTLWKHTFKLDITLEEGYIAIDGFLSKTGSYGREKLIVGKRQFEDETTALGNPEEEITYFDQDLSWEKEVEMFVKYIDENIDVSMGSSQDALKVMEMIEKAYHNAKQKE